MKRRTIKSSVSMQPQNRGGGFVVAQPLQALGVSLDPFLMVDWARMSTDPFGPHPHAGFSAVTWLLPFSEASVRNRDSLGDDSVFPPGSLHWFEAAHGAVHNESPVDNKAAELLQIFVNLPVAKKHAPAKTYRATPDTIAVVDVGDSKVSVVVGSFEGCVSPVVPRTPEVGILHVDLAGRLALPIPRGHNAVLLTTRGEVKVIGEDGSENDDNIVALNDDGDGVVLWGRGQTTLLHGKPLGEPVVAAGPFVMSTHADLSDAIRRYHSGAMGHVADLR